MTSFAPKVYFAYFVGIQSAREFLLKLDAVHSRVTKTIENARPPRFLYEWKDDKTLIMTYKSERGLIDFAIGLIKGVGKYFKEDINVVKVDNDKAKVTFQ